MRRQLLLSFIAALIVLQLFTGRGSSGGGGGGDNINTALYTLYAAGLSVVCFKYFLRNVKTVLTTATGVSFFVYLIWIVASVIWSIDKFGTLLHTIPLYLAFFLSIAFADIPPKHTVTAIILAACFVALLSWPVGLMIPSIGLFPGFTWRLQGITGHPQFLSLFMSVAALCLVLARFRGELDIRFQDLRFWFVALLIGVTALATKARAFTTFAVVALIVTFYVSFSRRAKIALVLAVVAMILFLATHLGILMDIYERGGTTEDLTLSGRVTIWIFTLLKIRLRPWLGYGFATFSPKIINAPFTNYAAPHAHNTWIQAAFETGIIGALLTTIFMGWVIVSGILYYRRYNKPNYSLVLMIFALFSGLTGVVFGFKLVPVSGMILLLAVQEAYQARLMTRQRRKTGSTSRLKHRQAVGAPQSPAKRHGGAPPVS